MSDTLPPPNAQAPAVTSRHVARGVGTTLLSRLGAVIEIVAQPLYVALFGLASFGLYAVLWATINLIENIFDLGQTSALQRTVPQAVNDEEAVAALRTALIFGIGPCLAVALGISLAADQIAPLLNVAAQDEALVAPSIRLFIWALPLWALVEVATSALRARHLFGPEIRLRLVWEMLIRLALAVTLYLLGFGLTGLFIAHLASLAITAALCLRLVARHYPLRLLFRAGSANGIARETFWAGLSVLPSNIVARLFGDAPALALNLILPGADGARAAALFTIARKISSVVQLVRIAFVYVLAPLASSAERADRAQVAEIYAYAVRLILVIALPLALVLAAGSAPLLSVFGAEADMARDAVVILLVARAAEAVLGISLPVLQVVADFRHQLTASLVGLAVAGGAGWLLAGLMPPLTGVTLAVALGFIVAAAIPMVQLRVHEGLDPFDGHLCPALIRTGGITAVAFVLALLAGHLPDGAALPLILLIGLAAIWCALRFALPLHDRASLGKAARKLRLVPAA